MENIALFPSFSTVKFPADLYVQGESTYDAQQCEKMANVTVTRTKYKLSKDAMAAFEDIHDEWELNICQRDPHDPSIGGKYTSLKAFRLITRR